MEIPEIETRQRSELPYVASESKLVQLSNNRLMLFKFAVDGECSWWLCSLEDLLNKSADETVCYRVDHDPENSFLSLHW